MLMGDMDPEMFHQPDLHFSDNYANLTNPAPSGTIPASVTSFLGTPLRTCPRFFGHL